MYEELENEKEALMMIYGTTKDLPVDPILKIGPTLEESIEKAGENVLKLKKRGYPCTFPEDATPSSIYENEYRKVIAKKEPKENKNVRPSYCNYESDEVIIAWMSLPYIKDAIKDIKKVPFKDMMKRNEAISNFQGDMISCLHQMKEDNLITNDKKKQFSQNAVNYFSKEVDVVKKRTLVEAMKKNQINVEKCKETSGMEVYFPELFVVEEQPEKRRQEEEKNFQEEAQRVERRVKECLDTFSFMFDPVPKTVPVSPRNSFKPLPTIHKATSRIIRPMTIIKKPTVGKTLRGPSLLSSLNKKTNLWRMTDPMKHQRDGKFVDTLKKFDNITKDFNAVEEVNVDPTSVRIPDVLQVSEEAVKKQEMEKKHKDRPEDKIMNTAPVLTKSEKAKLEKEEEENLQKSYETLTATSQTAMDLVLNYKIEAGGEDSEIDKLKDIWEELGVSVNQKLDLLIKYTVNADESNKLKESFHIWEQCAVFAKQFNECYIHLKDYIRFEYNGSTSHYYQLNEIIKSYIMCEDSIKAVEKQLKEGYGDDFVINRERASDVILRRRQNLARIFSDHNIPIKLP